MYTDKERAFIKRFFDSIGEIVYPDCEELVEQTAHAELEKFCKDLVLSGSIKLVLGRTANSKLIAKLDRSGAITVGNISAEDDGYEIKSVGDTLAVAGANPRAVLHAVYALEDLVTGGQTDSFDVRLIPDFRSRSDALGHYHSISVNLGNDTIDDTKAEYLARLGINRFCACFDHSPFGSHLSEFVHSSVFPFMRPPVPEAVEKLKSMSRICRKYGIDMDMMFWEPVMPALFAPLDQYPPEALGRVRRPWGGDENHLDTTLCLSSPLVQDYYRDVIVRFIREYPDVAGIFTYGLDGPSWLCTPELCPRCRAKLVDTDPSAFNPWETQADFITLMCETAHAERPDFKINFWGPANFYDDAPRKMYERAQGYDCITTGEAAQDHDLFVPFPEKPAKPVADTLECAEKRGAGACVYFAFNRLEAIQIGFPSPFTVADSLKIFKRWGFRRVMEVTGPTAALNQINALAMKKFESDTDADVESFLQELAEKQYGTEAGPLAYRCWEHTRDAFECWRHYEGTCMLDGSQFFTRISTFYGENTPIILPDVIDKYDEFQIDVCGSVDPGAIEKLKLTLKPEFFHIYERMEKHLAKAEAAAEAAAALAPEDERIGLCYYVGSFEGLGRPTMREYALLSLSAVSQAHMMCRQRINMLKAVWLLRRMRAPGGDEEARRSYLTLMAEDIKLQEEYVEMLKKLLKRRPCLPLTGICEDELRIYLRGTCDKIEQLRAYLAENAN